MGKYADRTADVLDRGRRSWDKNTDAGGDADVFYTEYVIPLRELCAEGLFEGLHEHVGAYRGAKVIDRLSITGPINLDYDIGRED